MDTPVSKMGPKFQGFVGISGMTLRFCVNWNFLKQRTGAVAPMTSDGNKGLMSQELCSLIPQGKTSARLISNPFDIHPSLHLLT